MDCKTPVLLDAQRAIAEMRKPVQFEFIGAEKEFESEIFANIDEICEVLGLPAIIAKDRQRLIRVDNFHIKPDIIVRHADDSMTVFEVKRANEKYPSTGTSNQMNAVGQLLLYRTVLEAKTGCKARLALIDNKIYYRTFCAFRDSILPITLIDYQYDRLFVPYWGW